MNHAHYRQILRIIHLLIVIYLFSGMFYIYYAAVTGTFNFLLGIFVVSLIIEGIIIYLNKGNCPFGYIQRKFGDDVPFFELVLPKKYAKKAVRYCAYITLLGLALLGARLLLSTPFS